MYSVCRTDIQCLFVFSFWVSVMVSRETYELSGRTRCVDHARCPPALHVLRRCRLGGTPWCANGTHAAVDASGGYLNL